MHLPFSAVPFFRLFPAALVALLGSASLAAQQGKLELVGLPAKARPGSVLTFRVETRDIPEGTPVQVTYELREAVITGKGGKLPASGSLTETYRVPEGTPRTWLTICAKAGDLASEPVSVAITDAEARPAAAGSGPAAPAAPPAAPASPLDRLPKVLKGHVATFLDTGDALALHGTSRGLRGQVSEGIRTLFIQGKMDRDQLLRLLRERSHVESVTLGSTRNLNSSELVQALEALPRLKRLTVHAVSCLTVADAVFIAQSHAAKGFDELSLETSHPVRPEDLAQLPDTMRSLTLSGRDLRGPEFGRFRNLAHLEIRNGNEFTGVGLPPELPSLTLFYCPRLTTATPLPAKLQKLVLDEMPEFHGPIHLAELRSLKVIYCPRFSTADARQSVAASPHLKSLELQDLNQATLQAAPRGLEVIRQINGRGSDITDADLAAFPSLRVLQLCRASFSGSGLPASLRELTAIACDDFRTENVASLPLTVLEMVNCDGATGNGLSGSLRTLKLRNCPAFPLKNVAGALDRMGSLDILEYQSPLDGAITAPDLEKIRLRAPSMTRCTVEREFGDYAINQRKKASAP